MNGIIPDTKSLRIPVKYLANLLTAGKEQPVVHALDRMLAMRAYMRAKSVDGTENLEVLKQTGLSKAMVEDMYHIMAIANYEDRFVIPSSHKEMVEDSFNDKGSCGFSFGNGCSDGVSDHSLFGKKKQGSVIFVDMPKSRKKKETEGV
jgi:nitrate reductase / nitrite oxidoreductase, beta subunit